MRYRLGLLIQGNGDTDTSSKSILLYLDHYKLVNYTKKWLKIDNFHEKPPITKINSEEFQNSLFNSVSILRKVKQCSLTYLPFFL